jgi:hypothetical protein
VLGLVASLVPAKAAACGACSCYLPQGIRPQATNQLRPINARFLIALGGLEAPEVRWTNLATGESVPFARLPTSGSSGEVWIVPKDELPTETEFSLEVGAPGEEPLFEDTFTTSSSGDVERLEVELPEVTPIASSAACGDFHGALLHWDEIRDGDDLVGFSPIVMMHVESGSESVVLFADADYLGNGRGVTLAAPGGEESADCWAGLGLPFGDAGEELTVTLAVYDQAGNETVLEPFQVVLTESPGATCPSDNGSGSSASGCSLSAPIARAGWAGFGLLALAGFGLGMRRRHARPE